MAHTVVPIANLNNNITNGNPSQATMRGRIGALLGLNDAPLYNDLTVDWNPPNGNNFVKITCDGMNANDIKTAVT